MAQENEHLGTGFEQKIIQAMICDHPFAEQLLDVIEPELFDMPVTKELAKLLKEYYFKYKAFPTTELIFTIIGDQINNAVVKTECANFIKKIQEKPLNGDGEYVKEKSLLFFRTQHVKNVLANDVLPKIKNHNLDEIAPLIQNALSKGADRNIGFEYHEDQEKRFVDEIEIKIPTPWEIFNKLFRGGWGAKRLFTFIGPSGSGKSFLLVVSGKAALLAGKTVVHYTLELDEIELARRYDASLTGVDINDIPGSKTKVLAILKSKLPPGAKLIIKEYPMKSASIQTIKSHLAKLALKGVHPDMILIDYGDLLKPMEVAKEKRHGLEAIWQDMKALAQEMKLPVLTVTQTNRTGADSEIITIDQVSEDFSKIMHSDCIITISRNMDQKLSGVGKMLLAKSRQSSDGHIFDYTINTAKADIQVFEANTDQEAPKLKSASSILEDYLSKQKKAN